MNKFTQLAQKELSLSPLMENREKMDTSDVEGRELTIVEFDTITMEVKGKSQTFPVVVFAEEPDKFYFGGYILMKLVGVWTAEYDSMDEASADLKKEGGCRVRFESAKTRSGNNLTKLTVVG